MLLNTVRGTSVVFSVKAGRNASTWWNTKLSNTFPPQTTPGEQLTHKDNSLDTSDVAVSRYTVASVEIIKDT